MGGNYQQLEQYIEHYWPTLKQVDTSETRTAFGLPNPYYAPSTEVMDRFSFPYMFYWDSYFICQGFWGTERESEIVGIAENMFDLIRRFGFMPSSNSVAHMSRSQPPLLAMLVKQIAERLKQDDEEWLGWAYDNLQDELQTCWYGELQPHIRRVYSGLSRYYDFNVLHNMAEAESGWDYTDRFNHECLDYLPVDLNALLYNQEIVLADLAERLGRNEEHHKWRSAADHRKEIMNHHLWHVEDEFYYDFNFRNQSLSQVGSLAAYAPMFVGMVSDEQADGLVRNLSRFETDFGLTATENGIRDEALLQWTAPNGWAPLHDMVVDGLLRYGYETEAKRIAKKWVETVEQLFIEKGIIIEKYNVFDRTKAAKKGVYPDQVGFGWTNGVTHKFIQFLK